MVALLGVGWTLENGKAIPSDDTLDFTRATVEDYKDCVRYTGAVIDPDYTVRALDGTVLVRNTDYTVTYSGTVKEIGNYTVTFTGIGSYTGVIEKTLRVSLYDADLRGDDTNGWYVDMQANMTTNLDLDNVTNGFTFRIYDDGGRNGNYSNNQNSYLIVTVPEGMLLRFSGTGVSESCDYLRFYDNNTSTQIGSGFSSSYGFSVPQHSTSRNKLIVYFYTDNSVIYAGFEVEVEVIDPACCIAVTLAYGTQTKTVYARANETLTLPEFNAYFTLAKHHIFEGWQIGQTAYQPGDVLTVTAPLTVTAQISEKPVLESDGEGGYFAKIYSADRTLNLTGKPDGFTFKVYDSGGKNGYYDNNENGSLTFTVPAGCVLKVSGSGSTENNYDYVRIYDGETQIGSDRYMGSFTMDELSANSGSMKITFHSDGSGTYSGFVLTVTMERVGIAGDINGDGSLNIADVTALLTILSGNDAQNYAGVADLNGDGEVNIGDVTVLLGLLSQN